MAGLLDLLSGTPAPTDPNTPITVTGAGRLLTPPTQTNIPTQTAGTQLSAPTMPSGLLSGPPDPVLGASGPTAGNGYDNSMAVHQVQQANVLDQPPPGGYGKSPGIYGLLPDGLQHGTLRSILGSIGDAMLIGSGHEPMYRQNQQRLAEGNALAGYDSNDPASVQAAISRLASTGAPGALDAADKLQQSAESVQLRKTQMDYNNIQRQAMNQNRDQVRLQGMLPSVGGMLGGVDSSAKYDQAYDQIARRTKSIGQGYDPEDLGLPAKGTWTPGATSGFGMTANNEQVSADKGAQRNVSVSNNANTNASRERAAGTAAGAHVAAASIGANKPTDGTILQALTDKQNAGKTLTPAEQIVWKKLTNVRSGGAGVGLAPGLTPGGPGAAKAPQFQNNTVYTDKNGNKARYVNGSWVPVH